MKIEVIGDATLYLDNCLDSIPTLSIPIDAVVTDPPYGDGENVAYGTFRKQIHGNENPLFNCSMLAAVYPKMRRHATLYNFTTWKHIDFLRHFIAKYTGFTFKHTVVWDKNGIKLGGSFRPAYELILVVEKGKPKYRLADFSDVQRHGVVRHDASTHPHEKPLPLIERCVLHSTDIGGCVLDPFLGSGTTAVACIRLGRKFIGMEVDPLRFESACERVHEASKQPPLMQTDGGGTQTDLFVDDTGGDL